MAWRIFDSLDIRIHFAEGCKLVSADRPKSGKHSLASFAYLIFGHDCEAQKDQQTARLGPSSAVGFWVPCMNSVEGLANLHQTPVCGRAGEIACRVNCGIFASGSVETVGEPSPSRITGVPQDGIGQAA